MQKLIVTGLLSVALTCAAARADDDQFQPSTTEDGSEQSLGTMDQQPGTAAGDTGQVSTAEASEVTRGMVREEVFGVRPQAGVMVFSDSTGTTSRMTGGLTLDWNLAKMVFPKEDNRWYLGPSSGLIYSHLGATGSGFVGTTDTPEGGNPGANFFQVPINLKAGYAVTDQVRLAVHGGGNFTHRNVSSSMELGNDSLESNGTVNRVYPNVGADFEWGIAKNVLLMVRPDVTIAPLNSMFTGTLGLGIALG